MAVGTRFARVHSLANNVRVLTGWAREKLATSVGRNAAGTIKPSLVTQDPTLQRFLSFGENNDAVLPWTHKPLRYTSTDPLVRQLQQNSHDFNERAYAQLMGPLKDFQKQLLPAGGLRARQVDRFTVIDRVIDYPLYTDTVIRGDLDMAIQHFWHAGIHNHLPPHSTGIRIIDFGTKELMHIRPMAVGQSLQTKIFADGRITGRLLDIDDARSAEAAGVEAYLNRSATGQPLLPHFLSLS